MLAIDQRSALILLLVASTLGVMAGPMVMPVIEILRADLGLTGTEAGLIVTVHGLAIAVVGPITGAAVDRFGIRLPLVVGLVIYGIFGTAGAILTDYTALIASRIVFGVGAALVFTCTTTAILTMWKSPLRGRVMGWRTTATSAGGVVFPLFAGTIASLVSWHAAFAVYLVGLPLAVIAMRVLPKRPVLAPSLGGNGILSMLRKPSLLGVYGLFLMMAVLVYSIAVFIPQRLGELGITSPIAASIFMAVMAGAMSLAGLFYGRLRRILSKFTILRIAAACWTAAYLTLGLSDSIPVMILATMALGAGNGLGFSTLSLFVGDLVPERLLGRGTALSATVFFLGQFLTPLLLGPVMHATSINAGFLGVGAAALAIFAALCLIRPAPEVRG
ncbi:MFS transporter [Acuticoccus sp. M5D2P5]|uniref:MFS transporter n=1 Tax=Acuticoccus kalidii TaxID=2910977 RepID=UPI001F18B117|nr:MFS transporter [Acuticoccus kalidii]MCF3933513.1 MFS transporter [Acuticoccus kalidii]